MKTLPFLLLLSLLHFTYGQYIRTQQFKNQTCEGEVFNTLYEIIQCHKHADDFSTYHYFTYDNQTKLITEFACQDENCTNCTLEAQAVESSCNYSMSFTYVSNITYTDAVSLVYYADEKCARDPVLVEQYEIGCSTLEEFSFLTECADSLIISSCSSAGCSTTNNSCSSQTYPLQCTYNDVYGLWIQGKCSAIDATSSTAVLLSFPAVLVVCFFIVALGLCSGGFIWWMHTRGGHPEKHKELKDEKETVEMS